MSEYLSVLNEEDPESVMHRIRRFAATGFYIFHREEIESGQGPECLQYNDLVKVLEQTE